MKAVLPLFFMGLGAAGASAQTAPGDPAGNQTIPEKDLSRPDASRHGGAQGGSVVDDHDKNLSNKLDASGGMIKPPPGVWPEPMAASRDSQTMPGRQAFRLRE
jgi:hypothetical protein